MLVSICKRQWRVSMNGRDSLDFGVLIEAARALRIPRDRLFLQKLSAFESEVLEIWDKAGEATETDEEYERSLKGATRKFSDGK